MTQLSDVNAIVLCAQTAPCVPTPLPEAMRFRSWTPTFYRPLAPTVGSYGVILSAYHFFRVFRSRTYSALLILNHDAVVHRSLVVPAYFRYPFMDCNDLQIGLTWTHPKYRGAKLATSALRKLVAMHASAGRKLWYIVHPGNQASIAVSARAGFTPVGTVRTVYPLGLKGLSRYEIVRS